LSLSLGVVAALAPLAAAWVDHGHMLTAAVAARYAPPGMEAALSRLLGAEPEFVNFTDFPGAAVWMDHIKCSAAEVAARKAWCRGLATALGSHQFDFFHFFQWPYAPEKTTGDQEPPTYQGNPVDELHQAIGALFAGAGSRFMWSFNVRLLLHVVGDLHQPLHVSSYRNKTLFADPVRNPEGDDLGGNLIHISGNYSNLGPSLHQVWDFAGGDFMDSWPVDRAVLDGAADGLVAEHPPQRFVDAGRLNASWSQGTDCGAGAIAQLLRDAVRDTRRMVPGAYAEFLGRLASAGRFGRAKPEYSPSPEYVQFVRHTARSQIALGGYRLSHVMRCLDPRMPGEVLFA